MRSTDLRKLIAARAGTWPEERSMANEEKTPDPHAGWDTWDEVPYFKDSWYGIGIDTWEGPRLPCLGEGFLGFELREGVSDDEFRKLLVLMGECIARITYTGPAQPGWRPGRRA